MPKKVDLSSKIEKQLPTELVEFMQAAGALAQECGDKLYLVGGVVRDLLLGRGNLDLDLVVEGDAITLAKQLGNDRRDNVVIHPRFGTAKVQWYEWSVDIATARSETYFKPGALPTVQPGSIKDDLFRRDFTINAMAVELNTGHYGELLDLYGGVNDLEQRLVRVLHDRSFIDDATRIWRGLRYEQRLSFQFEADTIKLLKRDIDMLDTISGDRIRHELELALKEDFPEKVLQRSGELGVLAKLHPALKGDKWLAEKFAKARELIAPESPPPALYLALLAYHLSDKEVEQLVVYLRLRKATVQILSDTLSCKAKLKSLGESELKPSRIYALLHGCSPTALTAGLIAADSPVAEQHIRLFLDGLRYVKPALTGTDLKKLGVPSGPRMKEILERLREARLDGKVKTKRDEEEMVKGVGDGKEF
ncbi:CCA tRNA nucleotidyltransferase [Chloroflexota bacterium]